MSGKPRGRETARDMFLSLAVVGVVIAVILGITWRSKPDGLSTVNWQEAATNAVAIAPWPILVPGDLPEGFAATSARIEAESYGEPGQARWILGFVSNDNQYVSLWQSDGPSAKVIGAATNNGACEGKISIAQVEWTKCTSLKPQTNSLVRTEEVLGGEITYVVFGTLDFAQLELFAASLVPAK
jgi:hypothetical protein